MAASELLTRAEGWRAWLEEHLAEEVKIVSLAGVSSITDEVVIATAVNVRHLQHLSEEAMREAKAGGLSLVAADGLTGFDWVVLDFGFLMLHLQLPEVRKKFALEEFWEELRKPPQPEAE